MNQQEAKHYFRLQGRAFLMAARQILHEASQKLDMTDADLHKRLAPIHVELEEIVSALRARTESRKRVKKNG